MREPLLYDAISVHNPVTDLTGYLFDQHYLNISSSTEKSELSEEFGNIENEQIYNILKLMSPYEIPFNPNYRYITDLLMTYSHGEEIHGAHCRKFIAKMREVNQNGDFMFIKKLNPMESQPFIQRPHSYSFLALSLLFRANKAHQVFRKSDDIEKQLEQQRLEEALKEYERP